MNEKKAHYTELVSRMKQAKKWCDSPERTKDEVEQYMPHLDKLFLDLAKAAQELDGVEMTRDEILNGFKV